MTRGGRSDSPAAVPGHRGRPPGTRETGFSGSCSPSRRAAARGDLAVPPAVQAPPAYARRTGRLSAIGGCTETVIDTATGTVRGTVTLGDEAGNVAYDPGGNHGTGQMLADIQTCDQ